MRPVTVKPCGTSYHAALSRLVGAHRVMESDQYGIWIRAHGDFATEVHEALWDGGYVFDRYDLSRTKDGLHLFLVSAKLDKPSKRKG